MKRIGKSSGIIERIVARENLEAAIDAVLNTRARRRSPSGRAILRNREKVIDRLTREIRTGTFGLTGYKEMEVIDGPKKRKVQIIKVYERIGCHAVMNIVEEYAYLRYIRSTAASIKRRGVHDLLDYIRKDIQLHPEKMRYYYKGDVKKFYESISQDFMMYSLRRMFNEPILMAMFERFVRMMPSGLSIGLRSSQMFGNVLLSMHLDHYIKDRYGVKNWYRYCDDLDAHAATKKECWKVRDLVHECIDKTGLHIKPNECVRPLTEGLDFLGYVIYPDHTRLRKRNKQNMARKLHKVKSKKRRVQLVGSLYGQCKHANCRHLFQTLTGMSMEDYKRLKTLHLKPEYPDGKKQFTAEEINMSDLMGEEFLVMDYETDIVTSPQRRDYERRVKEAVQTKQQYLEQGRPLPHNFVEPEKIPYPVGKHIVLIRLRNGHCCKFYTGDKVNWAILEEMRKVGLPMYASIKKVVNNRFGARYVFDTGEDS